MEKKKLEEGFYKGIVNDETLTKANALLVIKCADLEQKVKKQQEVIDEAIKYIETCNSEEKLHSKFLNEDYISNYGALELLDILKGENNEYI